MSDSQAYTYYVNPVGSGSGENNLVNVTSPSWVLTFIRWKYRDTYRINDVDKIYNNPNQNPKALATLKDTLEPLVVVNDCINVTTVSNKNSFTPNMEATLLQTDVNYLTAIAPGDFVMVNMLNWESQANDIYNRASGPKPSAINGFYDGFKGLFKVQSVRRTTAIIDQETGKKGVLFKITGYAFTEFNNMLYFDPSVALQSGSNLIFAAQIATKWQQLVSANQDQSLQNLIKVLISSFIGTGSARNAGSPITGAQFQSPNDQFFMPGIFAKLLDLEQVSCAADVFNYWFGIQKYKNTNNNVQPKTGLNPQMDLARSTDGFYYTTTPCAGRAILSPEYWNQVKAWDILNQYVNKPLNEFFTCFRADPDNGNIYPTVVLRQLPFTNEDFFVNNGTAVKGTEVTMFMNLPRWKVSPALILSQDIGRDEALRVNYVQVFARLLQGGALGSDYTLESANHNYQFDLNDIQRSGLRPTVSASMFDLYGGAESRTSFNSPVWARIHADALIGGHLKFSGTFVCAGIPDPIAVGDNFEFEDVVYHIEQIVHTCTINPANGIKSFRTTISVSSGISVYSNATNGTSYPEMAYTNAYAERAWDYKKSQILPGVSESQAIKNRNGNVDDTNDPLTQPNTALPQPKQSGVFPDSPNPKNNNGNKS